MKVIRHILQIGIIFLVMSIPQTIEAAEMQVESSFTYSGKVTDKPIPPTDIPQKAKKGVTALLTGNLPTTGEVQCLGIMVLGVTIILLGMVVCYQRLKRTAGEAL